MAENIYKRQYLSQLAKTLKSDNFEKAKYLYFLDSRPFGWDMVVFQILHKFGAVHQQSIYRLNSEGTYFYPTFKVRPFGCNMISFPGQNILMSGIMEFGSSTIKTVKLKKNNFGW